MPVDTSSAPRIFISYSHDSVEHRAAVLALSNRLRTDGLDCQIDQYVNGFPPQGWQRWMEEQIEQADYVLLMCTPVYFQRYRGLDEDGGRGVNFEGVVISQHLYEAYYRNTKFVPVIPAGGAYADVPIALRQYNTYEVPRQYDDLYRYLSDQPAKTAPPLGSKRVMPEVAVSEPVPDTSSPASGWPQAILQDDYGKLAEVRVGDVVQVMRWIAPHDTDAGETAAGFWIADTPCTQALWFAVMGSNPAEFKDDLQRPVERVSWSAVQGFLRQLNLQVAGLRARLPTETEWERACRAGTTTVYVFGDSVSQDQVHFSAQSTVTVKALAADQQGLYGMHGNVWEWCQDDFDALGDLKVLRGGSWAGDAVQCRADARGRNHAGNRDYTVGFRFVVC